MSLDNLVRALTDMAARWLPRDRAEELARNLAGVDREDADPAGILEMIVRRRRHYSLPIEPTEMEPLARALHETFHRLEGPHGKS